MSGNAVAKIAKPELRGALIKQIKYNIFGAFIGASLITGAWLLFYQPIFYWQLQQKARLI